MIVSPCRDQLRLVLQPLRRHEGVGMPLVMVQEYTRQGDDRSELETRLPVMVDPLAATLSNRLCVHVDTMTSPE